jgi:hypothetical protein
MREIGKHAFDGACAPREGANISGQGTFSLGIFEWIPTANKKGVKRSAVKVRVKGWVSSSGMVYAAARRIVKRLDEGKYTGPKILSLLGENHK